jgi:hypothetical protein
MWGSTPTAELEDRRSSNCNLPAETGVEGPDGILGLSIVELGPERRLSGSEAPLELLFG